MLFADGKQQSWTDRLLDRISPAVPPPPSPAPPLNQTAWEKSVDSHKVNELTVYEVGLIVFNETQPYSDSDSANDLLRSARERVAHAIMNADNKFGSKRDQLAPTATPIEPSAKVLQNPQVRRAYEASLKAAREAYLSPTDPTNGATNFNFRLRPDKSNVTYRGGDPEGLPLKTQSGPFKNSYTGNDVPGPQVWINTYGRD
jgi:hypothetical protein